MKKKTEGTEEQAKVSAMMRSVWVQYTADGRINLAAIKSGQAFTVGWHQMQLRFPNYTLEAVYPLEIGWEPAPKKEKKNPENSTRITNR